MMSVAFWRRRCGLIFVASRSEKYLEMIRSVRSIARDNSWVFFCDKPSDQANSYMQ